MNIKAKLMMS